MKTVYIIRDKIGRNQCLGTLLVKDEEGNILFTSHLIERGWMNNKRRVSCVPAGKYQLRLERSERFDQMLWEAYGIPNRSECKFHSANFARQLNGCFAPGMKRGDIDGDGDKDVTNSRDALDFFHIAMQHDTEARLVVINDRF